jgi:hypothetical protein
MSSFYVAYIKQPIGLTFKDKLLKCYILSIALCGAETWTLRKYSRNTWEVLKCGAGKGEPMVSKLRGIT